MNKIAENKMPTFDQLMIPLVKALQGLGGSGTIDEIYERVVSDLGLPDEITDVSHNEKGSDTEVEYRLAWARTYLKKYGLLENSSRGIWAIAPSAQNLDKLDSKEIVKRVREAEKGKKQPVSISTDGKALEESEQPEELAGWQDKLHSVLLAMKPDAFERLTQRILRESGFIEVEVTGRTGDGGIDGKGILRVNGLISFHVAFQCKRHQGSIHSPDIRNFRGAMIGRVDKGLFITTGTFTRAAKQEANREGPSPIDLIDGKQLVEKLKELKLGVRTKMVEEVDVDWFNSI